MRFTSCRKRPSRCCAEGLESERLESEGLESEGLESDQQVPTRSIWRQQALGCPLSEARSSKLDVWSGEIHFLNLGIQRGTERR